MAADVCCYTQPELGERWWQRQAGRQPQLACVLGFTDTGLRAGISAAGATPAARRLTAIADAEFLINGPQPQPRYPLPPLTAGASPVLISRAVVAGLTLPVHLFNAGLPQPPSVPAIDLGGQPARCLTTGQALPHATVRQLFQQGLAWGDRLAQPNRYLLIAECVVGGTTTALALLTALGIDAAGLVSSSHPHCNHAQKWAVVQQGLTAAGWSEASKHGPWAAVAAVGDPMQIVVAGMAIAASRTRDVLLAGGTQMLAVYALMQAIAQTEASAFWPLERVVVGTTRWVTEDPTGGAVELARRLETVPLLATRLSFADSDYAALRAYEQGFVKEGVGAGGCAIAAHRADWDQARLLKAVAAIAAQMSSASKPRLKKL
ncbi:MAG: TIGR00303 family protein [Spirulinaceae cyanobacterium SM2_1_0]|nr:TIGR00303 family protein [Spirulinaceae cyanobacterium SM2_1_0]